jgi:hypothetical protein
MPRHQPEQAPVFFSVKILLPEASAQPIQTRIGMTT